MTVRIRRFDDAGALLDRAGGFLLAAEAAHNLILGILQRLRDTGRFEAEPAPYLAVAEDAEACVGVAVRTPPHGLVMTALPPQGVDRLADDLAGTALPSVQGPKDAARSFAERRPGPHRLVMRLRVFRADEAVAPTGVPGRMRPASAADRDQLVAWIGAFGQEAVPDEPRDPERLVDRWLATPGVGLVLWMAEGRPVSMAGFGGATPNSVRISAVYTPPELRGRGYASACVAALTRSLLGEGWTFCTLFTDLINPTSNAIYRRIGYRPVCDIDQYRFSSGSRPAGAAGAASLPAPTR